MPRAFHVDRPGHLQLGLEIQLERPMPIGPDGTPDWGAMAHLDARFPAGLTRFGIDYLIGRAFLTGTDDTSQETDLIFELVRRLDHAERPSRYSAIFASETLAEAIVFRDEFAGGGGTIWEVECDAEPFRADHQHLDLSGAPLDVWVRAERYWRSEGTADPRWELLLTAPVRVIGIA